MRHHPREHASAQAVAEELLSHIVVDDLVGFLLPLGQRVLLLRLLHGFERVELVEEVAVVGGADWGREPSEPPAAVSARGDVSSSERSAKVRSSREYIARCGA